MAFRQQQRPKSARQISYHAPEPESQLAASSSQLKRSLDQSEEWILFSPSAPSATTRTHTNSTERTQRTAGLSRFSEFGSLDTAARSDQDDDNGTFLGTEEELDSLDDGLHAFHEPSDSGLPSGRLLQSGETVLPTHDGLGEFQPDATVQEHMWQFERPRRRAMRRRSSVQRHLSILDQADGVNQEQERRLRIEKWRLDQSKALLEEIERETRRRRRMSMVSTSRSRVDGPQQASRHTVSHTTPSVADTRSESSDEGTENLSFWQRITRRVIRDLIGLDEGTLSVIFGEALPEMSSTPRPGSPMDFSSDKALDDAGIDVNAMSEDGWQTRLLERVAQELGILVHQLSEHPGAFSTYQRATSAPEYAGLTSNQPLSTSTSTPASSRPTTSQPTTSFPASAHFAPTFQQPSHVYSEASLWGIEEEPANNDSLDSSRLGPQDIAEDLAREREYWERELDVKMIFNFLVTRFSSSRSTTPTPLPVHQHQRPSHTSSNPSLSASPDDSIDSARRAAIIRQHHPLVSRTTDPSTSKLPTSSTALAREASRRPDSQARKDSATAYRTYFSSSSSSAHAAAQANTAAGGAVAAVNLRQKMRSSDSCASQSTKKSKRSSNSARNYWDLGGSVGSGSVFAGEA